MYIASKHGMEAADAAFYSMQMVMVHSWDSTWLCLPYSRLDWHTHTQKAIALHVSELFIFLFSILKRPARHFPKSGWPRCIRCSPCRRS